MVYSSNECKFIVKLMTGKFIGKLMTGSLELIKYMNILWINYYHSETIQTSYICDIKVFKTIKNDE